MKLHDLSAKGFRSIRDISFEIGDFLCLIGQNNHGKSNIFQALDLFFSSGTKGIVRDIFFRCPTGTGCEVVIEATFEDLSQAELEKLRPWTVDEVLTVSKKYWIDDGKPQVSYEALMKIPQDEWLRDDFEHYSDRTVVSGLPISEFVPESGRISKQAYKEATAKYIEAYPGIEYLEDRRVNPAGYKPVLEG
jgi:energy-coupling factor transporter ATP-binding protein EcfA2